MCGEIAGSDGHSRTVGKVVEHALLQLDDELMFFLVVSCSLDVVGTEQRDGFERRLQFPVERRRFSPREQAAIGCTTNSVVAPIRVSNVRGLRRLN